MYVWYMATKVGLYIMYVWYMATREGLTNDTGR